MATTTNYGWTTPDDTSLVKDGAAAIRTLGTSVDTTTKNLNPSTTLGDIEFRSSTSNTHTRVGIGSSGQNLTVVAGVPSWAASATSVLTTTGDTLYASAANTLARLGLGTSGQVLTVSGGLPAWATVSTGGMTLLASGTLSGSTTSLSSISGSYNDLQLIINDFYPSTNSGWKIRPNAISTGYIGSGTYNDGANAGAGGSYSDQIGYVTNLAGSSKKNTVVLDIFDYTNTVSNKVFDFNNSYTDSANAFSHFRQGGAIATTSAITSIDIITNSGTWSASVVTTGSGMMIADESFIS
jgi:hypothetical protein